MTNAKKLASSPRIFFTIVLTTMLVAQLLPSQQQSTQQKSVSDVVKGSLDSVVQIVVNDSFGNPFAEGSGFIVSADGKILTNHHVIADAYSATVKLNNGATFTADGLIADDPVHDLAVIKVPGKNLPVLDLGDSNHIAVGDHVVAIGSALGLDNSVSDGIVSAIRDEGTDQRWIQTTASASPGNSGGPLLSMDGRVVGILTGRLPEGENLNFAVPSSAASFLLSNSTVRPFGSPIGANAAPIQDRGSGIWTSMTTARDYKIRTDGDYMYIEWVNLPSALQSSTAFIRGKLKKNGDKWSGKTISHLPCEYKSSYSDYWNTGQRRGTPVRQWCTVESETEIDKLSENRIDGVHKVPSQFDCRKCETLKWESKPFTWIPK